MKEIIGSTTATPNPCPDWNQTDSTKANYIKNKPTVLTEEEIVEIVKENGGDAGVQSDWNQTDDTQLDYIKNKPTKVSYFTNDAGYLTEHQDLSEYAKRDEIPTKPSDIGAQPAGNYALADEIPTKLSQLQEDSAHRTVTDVEKNQWNNKSEFSGDYRDLINKPEIPSVPVRSVNGKIGDVRLTAEEVGALPFDTEIPSKTSDLSNDSGFITVSVATLLNYYLKSEIYKRSETYSASEVDSIINGLSARLDAFFDTDDTTLDKLSEIVAYIKSNKSLIDSITTSKISVSDIVNNLTTSVANKPLSAAQGVVLKALIDAIVVPTKVSELTNDSGYIKSYTETDPTVPSWAKAPTKPSYTKSEVGLSNVDNVKQYSASNPPPYPVTSVNGKTGAVVLDDYVKSVNGATPDANGNVEIQVQTEQIPIVDRIEDMVDRSKIYCLSTDGYLYQYKSSTTQETVTIRDDIVATADNGYIDKSRMSSSTTSDTFTTGNDQNGYHVTPLIDLTKAEYQGKTIQLHLDGCQYASTGAYAQWIQSRSYGLDKTVLEARPYTCDTNLSGSGLIDTKNGTISVKYNSATSATLTINVPPTYGSAKVKIGYLRFCGKGAVADSKIYITYQDTQTVTKEQWTNTGIKFVSDPTGIDTETLAKISALNNEGTSPSTVKLLAEPVLDFYNAAAYPSTDYSTSHLSKITYPYRADIPVPYTVKWNYNENAMRTMVAVDTKTIGTVNAYTMFTYDTTGLSKYPIYNLIPNTRYYYKVTHVMPDGSIVEAKSGNFVTSSEPWRLIYIDGTQNVRDLGGWSGLNGKRIKYGKIFRGAALSDSSFPELIVTGKGRRSLGELKVTAELNLGADDTETSIASNCAYYKVGYQNYATAITDSTARANFKLILEKIVSWMSESNSRNIYMHCQGGCDRTGTLSFLLLGLLGVSESDLAKEYELSSFSSIGFGRLRTTTKAVDTYDYVGMVEAIKTYSGSTLADKFYDFATTGCGISADTITTFRDLMLG